MIDITKLTIEEVIELKKQLANLKLQQLNKEAGIKNRGGKVTRWYPACKEWDWSLSNTALTRIHGITVRSAAYWRKQLGMPAPTRKLDRDLMPDVGGRTKVEIRAKYEALDWNKCDMDLSLEMGVSREYIRQMRAVLGKPKRYAWEIVYERFAQEFSGVTELSYKEARCKFQTLSQLTFRRYCVKAGITVKPVEKRLIHPWHLVNWELPNIILGEIWCIAATVVANQRANHNMPKPLFRSRRGFFHGQFRPLVTAEELKAKAYFESKNGKKVCESSELGANDPG